MQLKLCGCKDKDARGFTGLTRCAVRLPPSLSELRRTRSARASTTRITSPRLREGHSPSRRHCEERSDEAIHFFLRGAMDCFAALAMTTTACMMGGANGSRECAPDDELRDTHHFLNGDGFREGLILRSARLRASRRMAAGLMVRDARLRGLLTMRVLLALRTDLPAMANQIWASGLRQTNPTGKSLLIFRNCVKPRLQKYFCFLPTQIRCMIRAVPFRQEGRIAIVTNAGRDAVDAVSALDEMC